ncbi:hypothetical protein ACFPM0_26515 [Pseudonocardia sulfidoxydans]|uniref:hypothetical protein n=1 Tax=Pseudonocardia sulfidoxydans TaxID=54011 RepID=UPI003609832E
MPLAMLPAPPTYLTPTVVSARIPAMLRRMASAIGVAASLAPTVTSERLFAIVPSSALRMSCAPACRWRSRRRCFGTHRWRSPPTSTGT